MAYDGNKLSKLEALKLLAERTKLETEKGIKAAIAEAGHAKFEKVDTLPEIADAEENVMYLLFNNETNHYDIYAKIGENLEQLDDTSVNLEDYMQKEEGKELIATEKITKLDGIAENATKVEASATNGNIKINGVETKVYEQEVATTEEVNAMLDEVFGTGEASA